MGIQQTMKFYVIWNHSFQKNFFFWPFLLHVGFNGIIVFFVEKLERLSVLKSLGTLNVRVQQVFLE